MRGGAAGARIESAARGSQASKVSRGSLASLLLASLALSGAIGCKGGSKGDRMRRASDASPVEVMEPGEEGRRKAAVAEREPNDRAAEANALPLEAVGRGRFESPGDVDRYRVTVDKPGALTVTVSGLAAVDLVVELRDSGDAVVARSDRGGAKSSEGIGGYPATAGSYDVVVRAFEKPVKATKAKPKKGAKAGAAAGSGSAAAAGASGAAGSGSGAPPVVVVTAEPSEEYEVIATWAEAGGAGRELEPNPDAGTASDLAVGETVSGFIGWSGDVDAWKVSTEVLAATNALDVEVTGVEGVALTLEIRDGMSRPQATRKGGRGQPVAIHGYLPRSAPGAPPILFVVVSGDRSHPQLEYQLEAAPREIRATDELEPNDRPDIAQPFSPAGATDATPDGEGGAVTDAEAVTVLHARWDAGDVDCFALPQAAVRRRLEVAVSAAEKTNLAVELLVGDKVVASSDEAMGKLEHVAAEVPAGARAVVRIKGAAKPGEGGAYDVSWSEAAPAGEGTEGGAPAGSGGNGETMPPEE